MFIGRKHELDLLRRAIGSRQAELVIMYGRRRVGKSALLEKAGGRKGDLSFEAIQKIPQKKQIDHFLRQLAEQTRTPLSVARDWMEAFDVLTFHIQRGKHYVVFDEFPWMSSGRTELISVLKYFWDNRWKKNSGLTLVLCGSVGSFMLKHIVHSHALHNRKTLEIKLPPLPAAEAKQFFTGLRSDFETAKLLMIFGGIPKYLEQVEPTRSFTDNLDRLCFQRHGFFLNELETVFKEQFKVVRNYERIVRTLAKGSISREDLSRRLGIASGGGLSGYLEALEQADFVRIFSPTAAFGRGQKTRKVVLWDEWLRFYFTWVEPHRAVIETNTKPGLLDRLSGGNLNTYFGLCFEQLCMRNLPQIFAHLGLDFHQVTAFGPFFRQRGRKGSGEEGIQIDLLARRKGEVLSLFECKFRTTPVGVSVIDEVKRKVRFLRAPSRYTVERYLICAGDITPDLRKSEYFHRIAGLEAIFSRAGG